MTVAYIRADRNGATMGAVKLILLLQRGKVLPDGDFRHLQTLRKVRNGHTSLKLQNIQNGLMALRKGGQLSLRSVIQLSHNVLV